MHEHLTDGTPCEGPTYPEGGTYGICDAHDRRIVHHLDYPHEPGRLHGCEACERRCHCDPDPGTTACVYDGPHVYGKTEDSP